MPSNPMPRPVQQIKFTKMPLRTRAGSSPLRATALPSDDPEILITSPSRPGEPNGLRRGSLGTAETFKGNRPRKDTTTSSDFSSENELDPSLFARKQINPRRAAQASHLLSERIQEDEREDAADAGAESDDSTMSSEFAGTEDTASILGDVDPMTSLPTKLPGISMLSTPQNTSPRRLARLQNPPPVLQALPPPRPISVIAPPVSALTLALKAKNKAPGSPFDRFATLSGKGEANPLYIKIYAPFSSKPTKFIELLLKRQVDGGGVVSVAEAIGLALYRYGEEKLDPKIDGAKLNVNKWNFRMVEDDEVDFDFPALTRTRPITDFTSNNNRPARGRARDKPWDEFGIVEASEVEFAENEKSTPQYSKHAADALSNSPDTIATPKASLAPPLPLPAASVSTTPTPSFMRNPITGPSFIANSAIPSKTILADAPATTAPTATPRSSTTKTLTIHFTDENFLTRTTTIEVTTDTYIAEVFTSACKKLGVDKGLYVLKVSASTTVAPSDRTVEALGDRSDLDLVRRRFVTDGEIGRYGSPGSSSPSAPILVQPDGVAKKGKKAGVLGGVVGTQLKSDALAALAANAGQYKRYHVTRKTPMSFSSSSARILALDEEYMHIMPTSAEHHPTAQNPNSTAKGLFEAPGKVTTVHFSSVVGSKMSRRHPRMLRVDVFKEKETKRYDFEASSAEEAREIVGEVRRGVERVVGVL
jgi:hypothetical protein